MNALQLYTFIIIAFSTCLGSLLASTHAVDWWCISAQSWRFLMLLSKFLATNVHKWCRKSCKAISGGLMSGDVAACLIVQYYFCCYCLHLYLCCFHDLNLAALVAIATEREIPGKLLPLKAIVTHVCLGASQDRCTPRTRTVSCTLRCRQGTFATIQFEF